MTVKRKAFKSNISDNAVNDVIRRGGKTIGESIEEDKEETDCRFTLRIPQHLLDQIDKSRKGKVGFISRNQWILIAIQHQIDAEKTD